jgi:hypothetical protein
MEVKAILHNDLLGADLKHPLENAVQANIHELKPFLCTKYSSCSNKTAIHRLLNNNEVPTMATFSSPSGQNTSPNPLQH